MTPVDLNEELPNIEKLTDKKYERKVTRELQEETVDPDTKFITKTYLCSNGDIEIETYNPDSVLVQKVRQQKNGYERTDNYDSSGKPISSDIVLPDIEGKKHLEYYPSGRVKEIRCDFSHGRFFNLTLDEQGNLTYKKAQLCSCKGYYETFFYEGTNTPKKRINHFNSGEEMTIYYSRAGIQTHFIGTLADNQGYYEGFCWENGNTKEIRYRYKSGEKKIAYCNKGGILQRMIGKLPHKQGRYCGTFWENGKMRSYQYVEQGKEAEVFFFDYQGKPCTKEEHEALSEKRYNLKRVKYFSMSFLSTPAQQLLDTFKERKTR